MGYVDEQTTLKASKWTKNSNDIYFNTGNVGIGTDSPTGRLDVVGDVSLTGKMRLKSDTNFYVEFQAPTSLTQNLPLIFPTDKGASGNALITDGNGNLSWSAVATTATTVGGDLTGTIANATVKTNAVTSDKILDGTISNNDISATANIDQSKIKDLTTDLANKQDAFTTTAPVNYNSGTKVLSITPGASNTLLGVNNAGNGMEYKALGVTAPLTITHGVGTIGIELNTVPIEKGGTGLTGFTGDRAYIANGLGTALIPFSCASTEVFGFSALGKPTCTPFSAINGTYFNRGGNTFGTTARLGTNDANKLEFETNNTARMTITDTGNVGIGSTSPSAKLTLRQTGATLRFESETENNDNSGQIVFGENTTDNNFIIRYDGAATQPGSGVLTFSGQGVGDIMTWTRTKKVGVGITDPGTTMHVVSDIPETTLHPYRAGLIAESEGAGPGGRVASTTYSSNQYPVFIGYRARGTKASPEAVKTNDILFALNGGGFDGTNWVNAVSQGMDPIRYYATQDWTPTARGSKLVLSTTPNDSKTGAVRMVINQDGSVGVGTQEPVALMHLHTTHGGTINGASAQMPQAGLIVSNADNQYIAIDGNEIRQFGTGDLHISGDTGIVFLTGDKTKTNEVTAMKLTSAGKLGIGITNPTETLHVAGSIKVTQCPSDMELWGGWCMEKTDRPAALRSAAVSNCSNAGRILCPPEAIYACDAGQGANCTWNDNAAEKQWAAGYCLQPVSTDWHNNLMVLGGDNKSTCGTGTDTFKYRCCKMLP